ncbi:DUF6348 family protein [Kitasatospora sp. DSM 101779]|uniref:DUF6348 family protein n=1 Tax=Kitasatospora sp. DSM 101779 TaxID=2853165 RepID=UPI0021DB69B8|nr:DUF6348 family protein [Kitasatospora sp. DSM 101779]MCU7824790.1 hypothetical protein [Kitasatospora sp. DSM 101779]
MRAQSRLDVIQRSVVREMARFGQRFTVEGSVVRGPGTTAVAVREHPGEGGGSGHVDLGFAFDVGRADGPVVWDCTAGLGRTEEERLESAVRMWATTTAAAVVELQEGRGTHGDHVRPALLPGWQAVQGPAAVFGFDSERLSEWLAGHQLLPELAGALAPELSSGCAEPAVTGVKLFLGGRAGEDVAEVRVNGEVSEPASAALRALGWPRGERLCWARLFVLLVPEGRPAGELPPAAVGAAGDAGVTGPAVVASPAARLGVLARWRRARAGR